MALQKQIISFPFSGLSQKESPMLLDPGELLTLENGFFQNPNEIRKRYGYQSLYATLSGTGKTAKFISQQSSTSFAFVTDKNIVKIDNRSSGVAGSYTFSTSARAVLHATKVYTPPARQQNPASADSTPIGSDIVVNNNIAYSTCDGAFNTYDLLTGAVGTVNDAANWQISGYSRVVATASSIVMLNVTAGVLGGVGITTAGSAQWSNVAILAGFDASSYWDARASSTTADRINIIYRRTGAAGFGVTQINATTGAITIATVTDATEDVNQCLSFLEWAEGDGFFYAVTCSTVSGVRTRAINATTLAISAAVTVNAAATNCVNVTGVRIGATNYPLYDYDDGSVFGRSVWRDAFGSPVVTACALVSKAFLAASVSGGTSMFAFVTNVGSAAQGTVALIEFDVSAVAIGQMTAQFFYGSHPATTANCQISAVPLITSTRIAVSFLRKTQNAGTTIAARISTAFAIVDLSPSSIGPPDSLGGVTFLTGSCGHVYDGVTVGNNPNKMAPEAPTLVSVASGGSLTTSSSYQYVAAVAKVDTNGRLWRTAPSAPLTVATGSADTKATVRAKNSAIACYVSPTEVSTGVATILELYRTVANGTILYKVGQISSNQISGSGSNWFYSFIDTTSDAQIVGNEQLYTTGGVLPNYPGQCWLAVKAWRGRMWGISAEDPTRAYYTKQLEDGIGPAWVGVFNVTAKDEEGDFTAIGEMDDKLVLFKRAAVYVLTGDGPDRAGNGLYQNPERVATKAGTVNPSCVVKTPVGLIYQSPKGIHILTRALETQYIGAPVETVAASLTLTGAICLDDQNQVRFMSSQGTTLVYDWISNVWSTYTNQAAYHCCMWQNKATWIGTTTGTIYQETVGAWLDPGSVNITTKLITGWISFAQMQSYKRVVGLRLFGFRQASHAVTIGVAYDENDASLNTYPTITDVGAGVPYQLDLWVSRQKAGSVKVTIQDGSHSGTGEGARWHGLAFTVGIKQGVARTTT
jgi:hypothetical protein